MSQSRINKRREESRKGKRNKQLAIVGLLVLGLFIAFITQPGDIPSGVTEGLKVTHVNLAHKPGEVSANVAMLPSGILGNSVWKTDHVLQESDLYTLTHHTIFSPVPEKLVAIQPTPTKISPPQVRAVYGSASQKSALIMPNESTHQILRAGEIVSGGRRAIVDDRAGVKLISLTN